MDPHPPPHMTRSPSTRDPQPPALGHAPPPLGTFGLPCNFFLDIDSKGLLYITYPHPDN